VELRRQASAPDFTMIEKTKLKTTAGAGFARISRGLKDTAKDLRARMRESSFGPGDPVLPAATALRGEEATELPTERSSR
jgi:hypothetical protein